MTRSDKSKPVALVVDDEKDMLVFYTKALESQNYIVECAENGSEADFKLNRNPYSVIITDMHMPYTDGLTFVRNIKKGLINNKTPIIVVSGHLSKQSILALAKHGVTRIFSKPVNLNEFIQFVNKTIDYAGDPSKLVHQPESPKENEKEESDEIEVA